MLTYISCIGLWHTRYLYIIRGVSFFFFVSQSVGCRPVARIDFRGWRTPKKYTFWTQKVDFLNLTPLTFLQKPHFWPILWLKVDLLADFGGASHPLATGLIGWVISKSYQPLSKLTSLTIEINNITQNSYQPAGLVSLKSYQPKAKVTRRVPAGGYFL